MRVAVVGFHLEANRFSPPCGDADFTVFGPDRIKAEARAKPSAILAEVSGFTERMDELCGGEAGWTLVPISLALTQPAGPVEEGFFVPYIEKIRAFLTSPENRVDAVYIAQHGAAIATHTDDPDADMFALIRSCLGPGTPVVATLDLHANISQRSMAQVDVFVGYQENPHVDGFARGVDAASILHEMVAKGTKMASCLVRLPLVAPSVTMLTAEGQPYGDIIRHGQEVLSSSGGKLANVTILGGFAFSDTSRNGMTFIVTARDGDRALAEGTALDLAEKAWADRNRYQTRMTPLAEAVAIAKEAAERKRPPVLFADVADNPGGGGRGNTTDTLRAFHEAKVSGAVFTPFFDPAAVRAAAEAGGPGAQFRCCFASEEPPEGLSKHLEAEVVVEGRTEGRFAGTQGMMKGRKVNTGASVVLRLLESGVRVVCVSRRTQAFGPEYLDEYGVDSAAAPVIVVKSRGHFRAGFQHMFPPERIVEIDAPGLTTPNLAHLTWKGLPRPVYPLDGDQATWSRADPRPALIAGRVAGGTAATAEAQGAARL